MDYKIQKSIDFTGYFKIDYFANPVPPIRP